MNTMTESPTPSGDDDIRRVLQDELIERVLVLKRRTRSASIRLQIPNTDIFILAGTPEDLRKVAPDVLAAPDANLSAVREARNEAQWISVEAQLPEKECLAVYVTPRGKQRMIRAKYVRKFQIEAQGDDCETDYNEDDDTFYIKAGWLECIDNWGEYSSCYVTEGFVTHWQPLPEFPVAAPAASKEGDIA
jgi:hypothetical protein